MNELINVILHNLINVGIGILIFAIAYGSNMVFSLYYNVKCVKEKFDPDKLKCGFIKAGAFILGTALVTIAITTLPPFANYVGFTIPDQYMEYFNNLVIIGLFLYSSCKYVVEAISKAKKALDGAVEVNEVSI